MALSTATITFDLADWVGADLDARRTRGWITTNAPEGYVTDTAAGQIRIDDVKVSVADDGTGSVTVWVPGAGANPATWQTAFHFDVPRNGRRDRKTLTMGPFTITASANLASLIEEQVAVPAATASDYATAAGSSATDAATSATAAQGYAQQAAGSVSLVAWAPGTVYAAGDVRQASDGSTVQRDANGTSGATFDSTERAAWTPIAAVPGTMEADALTASIDDRAVGAGSNVKNYGVKGDGTTDDTAAIQWCLDNLEHIYFPKSDYRLSGALTLTGGTYAGGGKRVRFHSKAILKQTANVDTFTITKCGNRVDGLNVDSSGVGAGYTQTDIVILSDDSLGAALNNEITFYAYNSRKIGGGTAFKINAAGSTGNSYAYYNKVKGRIYQHYTGIKITIAAGSNGVNNNVFDVDINSAQQLMNVKGTNIYRGMHQATTQDPGNPDMACIYVDGGSNMFQGFVFDFGGAGLMKYVFEFSAASTNNTWDFPSSNVKGTTNWSNRRVGDFTTAYRKNIIPFCSSIKQTFSESYSGAGTDYISEYYNRNVAIDPQSNSLADLKNIASATVSTVNCTLSVATTYLTNLFNHNYTGQLRYRPTDISLPSSMTVDVAFTTTETIRYVGLIRDAQTSTFGTVRAYLQSGGTWYEMSPISGSRVKPVGVGTAYGGYDEIQFGSDVLFDTGSLAYGVYSTATAVRYVIEMPALAATNGTVPTNGYLSMKYLYVNTLGLNANRGNSGIPWLGHRRDATFTWDPPSIAVGGSAVTSVAVTDARLGDYVQVAPPVDLQGLGLSAYVSTVNTVKVVLTNNTAAAIDLASGTWNLRLEKTTMTA